jgi:uncharacterized membrane protein
MSPYGDLRLHLLADLRWAPPWVATVLIFALCMAAAWGAQLVGYRVIQRLSQTRTRFWPTFIARTHGPVTLAVLMLAASLAASLSPIPVGAAALVRQGLLIGFVVLIGWIANSAMQVASSLYLRRYKMDAEDNLLARKHRTQALILERILQSLLWVLTLAFALRPCRESSNGASACWPRRGRRASSPAWRCSRS